MSEVKAENGGSDERYGWDDLMNLDDIYFHGPGTYAMGGEVWGRICGGVGPWVQEGGAVVQAMSIVVRGRVDDRGLWWGILPEGLVMPGTAAARAIERMVARSGQNGVVGRIGGRLRGS